MKTKVLLRNVGDIWDKSGNKRVTAERDQSIINMASCRGISLVKDGTKLLFPEQEGIHSYIEHVADFLMPGVDKKIQMDYMNSVLIPVQLPVGDGTSEDYMESATLNKTEVKGLLSNCQLEPYVDGERAADFAVTFGLDYHSDFHDIFFKVRNKIHFHDFCVESGLPTIPQSIAAGMQDDYTEQCQDIFEAIKSLFERGNRSVMIRQATAAGGIGNARIERVGEKSYEVSRTKTFLNSDLELKRWLEEVFHKQSRTPGMMVAPFFKEGVSLSGIVEILADGQVLVPYVAQEILDDEGTSFQGAKIGNDLPVNYLNQAIALLTQAGMALKKRGVKQGRLQMDMRVVEGTVCGVESNSLRKTAVIEMFQILSNSPDWVLEGAKRLEEGQQKAFIGVEHIPVNKAFEHRVKQDGFHEAFNAFRQLDKKQAKKYLGTDLEEDIGVFLHSSTPPHRIDDHLNIGLIVANEAIRPRLGESKVRPLSEPLARLSLEEKWELVKAIFQA